MIKFVKRYFKDINFIKEKEGMSLYIVGGFLRDYLINPEGCCECVKDIDIDFIVDGDAQRFAKIFSGEIKGAFVVLHEKEKIYRVVKKIDECAITFDFTELGCGSVRGRSVKHCSGSSLDIGLKENVMARDFSINALVLDVDDALDFKRIIDITGGIKDLKDKRIRLIKDDAFCEDPLRLLRAYRFCVEYGFFIEKDTLAVLKRNVGLLKHSSKERVHDEIIKIFSQPDIFGCIIDMDSVGLLEEVFEEIRLMKASNDHYFHDQGLWGHALEVLFCFEYVIRNLDKLFDDEGREFLEDYLAQDKMKARLRIASLFHDIGKPECFSEDDGNIHFFRHEEVSRDITKKMLKRLKFSNKDIDFISNTCFYHMQLGNLAKLGNVTDKACYRYFKRTGVAALGLFLITLADWLASIRGREGRSFKDGINKKDFLYKDFVSCVNVINQVLLWYLDFLKKVPKERYITGNDLINEFGLKEGPVIGEILDAVEVAQAEKKIADRETAYSFVVELLKNGDYK